MVLKPPRSGCRLRRLPHAAATAGQGSSTPPTVFNLLDSAIRGFEDSRISDSGRVTGVMIRLGPAGLTSLRQGYGGPPKRFARRRKPCATSRRVTVDDVDAG